MRQFSLVKKDNIFFNSAKKNKCIMKSLRISVLVFLPIDVLPDPFQHINWMENQTYTIQRRTNWKYLARISTHNTTADTVDTSYKLWWTDVCLYVCVYCIVYETMLSELNLPNIYIEQYIVVYWIHIPYLLALFYIIATEFRIVVVVPTIAENYHTYKRKIICKCNTIEIDAATIK